MQQSITSVTFWLLLLQIPDIFFHTICTLQDGVLKEVNNTKLSLIADNGRHVESVFTKSDNIIVGDEIESDGHLILIDVSIFNYSLHLSVN